MSSDDLINPDGSTVHRPADNDASPADGGLTSSSESTTDDAATVAPTGEEVVDASEANVEPNVDEQIADAKTVIRAPKASSPPSEKSGRTPSDVAKVLVGQQLNQYRLEEMIGGGGMGAVFRGHDEQLDRTVAIKVIPFVGNDPELQRRFRNEAQNAAKLDHPRIARVFDAGSHDDWHYIVFEYIRGTNLRDLTHSIGVLHLDDAVYYTCQLAEALQHAADRGIVHRDIKPSNVLIGEGDTIKLVDMGLARSDNLDLSEDMTASGVTLGTFDYISPEQALDPRDADVRSDIYSLGCTLYFMLTGEPPYTGGTMLQKLLSHGNAPLPDPRDHRSDLPDDLVAVMQRMMAKEPKYRYQNASDLVADLMEVAYRHQLKRSLSLSPTIQPAPINAGLVWFQNNAPWLITAALVLIIAGWIELRSAAARNEFVLSPPESVAPLPPGPISSDMVYGVSDRPSPPEQALSDGSTPGSADSEALGANSPGNASTESTQSGADLEFPVPLVLTDPNENPDGEFLPLPLNPLNVINDPSTAVGSMNGPLLSNSASETMEPETSENTQSMNALSMSATIIRVVDADIDLPPAMPDSLYIADGDGAALVTSLEEAISLAEQLDVDRIEILAKRLVSGPITIRRDDLTLVSLVPGGTEIEMRSQDSLDMDRAEMFVIGSNRVSIQGLHFQWELPTEQVNGGSLFVVNENRMVRMSDTSVTVINRARHENVFVVSVMTSVGDESELPVSTSSNSLPLVGIQLDNVIVRGEVSMMKLNHAAALQLVWNNGLLAITGRMIDTYGARLKPTRSDGPMQLKLSGLTAETQSGFLRMRLVPGSSYLVQLVREAVDCVFVVSPGNSHIEFEGLDELSMESPLLKLRGQSNSYSASSQLSDPMLMLTDTDGNSRSITLDDLDSESPEWFQENSTLWSVWWSSDEVRDGGKDVSEVTPKDYRQDGPMVGGFDETLLPTIPDSQVDSDPDETTPAASGEFLR